jgi:FtsP/CotA-like multicopper oxidase with cupredoxin domain
MKKILIETVVLIFVASIAVSLEMVHEPFSQPLPIPPILEDENPRTPELELSITAMNGEKTFFRNVVTPTIGYSGNFLGPTIRAKRGQKILMNINNQLKETTTVHWHGLHVPGEMDGGPHQMIEAGETWEPYFTINQPAATLWYHPHPLGKTGKQVYQGLAGLFIIDDEESERLPLPADYGIDDIPLIIQDRRFNQDGSFAYIQSMPDIMHGVIGNVMLVNGSIQPVLNTKNTLLRLRILNGSNASLYRITFTGKDFLFIASDGGFIEEPVSMQNLILSPGERGEILLDLSNNRPGDELYLEVEEYNGGLFKALKIQITSTVEDKPEIPGKLAVISRINENQADKTRQFILQSMGMRRLSINGKQMNMSRIDETVKLGATEIWEIQNRGMGMMSFPHSFHVHDVQFQILSRDGSAPAPHEAGWKDTVLVWPNEHVRIIAKFEDYTGLYMYHCHILEHEDAGMMGQFQVVAD